MDGYRLSVNVNNTVTVFDYDGTNQTDLVPVQAGYVPFFDRNYEALYTIAPSLTVLNKPALTRTLLQASP
jgi:hypothetical protein